jgi:hypothetical protein
VHAVVKFCAKLLITPPGGGKHEHLCDPSMKRRGMMFLSLWKGCTLCTMERALAPDAVAFLARWQRAAQQPFLQPHGKQSLCRNNVFYSSVPPNIGTPCSNTEHVTRTPGQQLACGAAIDAGRASFSALPSASTRSRLACRPYKCRPFRRMKSLTSLQFNSTAGTAANTNSPPPQWRF